MKKIIYDATIKFKLKVDVKEENIPTKEVLNDMLEELFTNELDRRDKYEIDIVSTMEVI
jgi:hypothetical protein